MYARNKRKRIHHSRARHARLAPATPKTSASRLTRARVVARSHTIFPIEYATYFPISIFSARYGVKNNTLLNRPVAPVGAINAGMNKQPASTSKVTYGFSTRTDSHNVKAISAQSTSVARPKAQRASRANVQSYGMTLEAICTTNTPDSKTKRDGCFRPEQFQFSIAAHELAGTERLGDVASAPRAKPISLSTSSPRADKNKIGHEQNIRTVRHTS